MAYFKNRLPYISEMLPSEPRNLPYIGEIATKLGAQRESQPPPKTPRTLGSHFHFPSGVGLLRKHSPQQLSAQQSKHTPDSHLPFAVRISQPQQPYGRGYVGIQKSNWLGHVIPPRLSRRTATRSRSFRHPSDRVPHRVA